MCLVFITSIANNNSCHVLTIESCLFSMFVRSGVIKGGLSRGIVYICWPGMVPNQRQLFIVVSDWGSYLGSHFPIVLCGILSTVCLVAR